MKYAHHLLAPFLLLAAFGESAMAQRPVSSTTDPNFDWLVAPSPFKAQIIEDKDHHRLILDNGLARRVIQLRPNAATVSLQNLTTGEHMLRAVAPEARVKVHGVDYCIGGLKGQPVANYLKTEWLATMATDLQAYRYAGCTIGETEARFPWLKHREWMSRDLPWPPPGKHVVLRFVPPPGKGRGRSAPVVLEEVFSNATSLNQQWKTKAASGFDRASFVNEGRPGEIMATAAMAVCAEHVWPAGARSVEVLLTSGTDRSAAWGPGLALVTNSRVLRFNTRPGERKYEAHGKIGGTFNGEKPCRLRVRLADGRAVFEAAQDGDQFTAIGSAPCQATPTALRVGKVGLDGSGADVGADKTPVRLRILQVTWRGKEQPTAVVAAAELPDVDVHYEIYDGLPLFQKWMVIRNTTAKSLRVNSLVSEELRLVNVERGLHPAPSVELPMMHVETDYSFGSGGMTPDGGQQAVIWENDKQYAQTTQSGAGGPTLLQCKLKTGPEQDVPAKGTLESFRAFELLLDSTDRERRGLSMRRMYRAIAPWSQENPLMFHKLGSDKRTVRDAIAQASEVGFEMIIMSFGSGFNFESSDPRYIARYRRLSDEARAKGVVLGGYSLLASRGAGTPTDNTQGSPAMFGRMPCLGAAWGQAYLATLRNFMDKASLRVLEHDGSYPGDRCGATNHPGHRGLEDSQWVMWRAITDLYKWSRGRGVYLNIPDWYFLAGGSKCAMHYRESNWSLPRAEQEIIERQNIFDGTWQKTPSMGWMFVPLAEYHGGGAAATIEPLDQHRDHYERRLANLFGAGVQACYRGPRLYDTDATKQLVKKWVTFYKAHRQVLDSDIIHLRRANGLDWDGIVHVNPQGKEKAMAFLYNPLKVNIERDIRIPLYYAGLSDTTVAAVHGGAPMTLKLARDYSVTVKVKIAAESHSWIVFTAP